MADPIILHSTPRLLQFVGTVAKNRREVLDRALREFNHRPAVDLRIHALRSDDHVPTCRCIAIGIADLPPVIQLLIRAECAAVARSLLPEGSAR